MTYDFLVIDRLTPSVMAAALADLLRVPPDAVDVADADTDRAGRNWDAPVLCDYTAVPGDVALALDIYVQDSVARQPTEPDMALRLAARTRTAILYPAEEAPPSAYWLATPNGLVTRARVVASDDVPPSYAVEAVEAAVPELPRARVTQLPEIVREQRVPTPTTDDFVAAIGPPPRPPSTVEDKARTALLLWELMVRRMADGWQPSGRYPIEMYGDDLRMRDRLARLEEEIPEGLKPAFRQSVETLDRVFTEHTTQDDGRALKPLEHAGATLANRAWWWQRRPLHQPWDTA